MSVFKAPVSNDEVDLRRAERAAETYKELYYDLLYQVQKIYPGESRHETAKRFLKEHQSVSPLENVAKQSTESEKS